MQHLYDQPSQVSIPRERELQHSRLKSKRVIGGGRGREGTEGGGWKKQFKKLMNEMLTN